MLLLVFASISVADDHGVGTHGTPRKNERVSLERCPVFEDYGMAAMARGTLSPFWHQHYIGSDLARSAVSRVIGHHEVPVGTMDLHFLPLTLPGDGIAGFRAMEGITPLPRNAGRELEHGSSVANLAFGAPPLGVAARPKIVLYLDPRVDDDEKQILERVRATRPKVLNISLTFSKKWSDRFFVELGKLTTVVYAAGNLNPVPIDERLKLANAIVVGNLNEWGGIRGSSQQGPMVDVVAPAGSGVLSFGHHLRFDFDGTSAAAPLVSGAVANALSIVPDLDAIELKQIVRGSATPLLWSTLPKVQRNGTGLLNALKIVEVAKRLKGLSSDQRKQKLSDPKLFDFSADANEALVEAKRLLREGRAKGGDRGCLVHVRAVRELQRAFFLASNGISDATFRQSAQLLAQISEEQGLNTNAEFYRSLDPKALAKSAQRRVGLIWDEFDPESRSVYRDAAKVAMLLDKQDPSLANQLWSDSKASRDPLIEFAPVSGAESVGTIDRILVTPELRQRLNGSTVKFLLTVASEGGADALALFERELKSEEPFDRKNALSAVGSLGLLAAPLIDKGMSDREESVRITALQTAFGMKEMDPATVFRRAIRDPSERVREAALNRVFRLKNRAGVSLLASALREKNETVSAQAVSRLFRLEEESEITVQELGPEGLASLTDYVHERVLSEEAKDLQLRAIVQRLRVP